MTTTSTITTNAPLLASPVVSTQWLCDHLGAESLIVLDATVLSVPSFGGEPVWLSGLDEYLVDGHIPGALFADLIEEFSDGAAPFAFTRPSAARFEEAATALGISNGTTVVVYDRLLGQWAARLWWLFRAFGYDQVAVLSGGFTKWGLEERPSETGYIEPAAAGTAFEALERPELWVDASFVARVVDGNEDALLICALPPKEFTGETGRRSRLGHIPGSSSVPAARLVDRETNALLPKTALGELFEPVLDARTGDERIVLYCGAGIAAASDALALTLLGVERLAIYDGSLNEWVADADAPVVTSSVVTQNGASAVSSRA